jgi:hypothetical protein
MQIFGVDYNETFAHVAKFVSICCILAVVAIEDMEIHQMDVKLHFSMVTLNRRSTWNNRRIHTRR